MTIKEFAYSAQQHLQAQTGQNLKRAHIYEFLAASFGFNSFAALCTESVVFHGRQEPKHDSQYNQSLRQRCLELGYQSTIADIVFSEFPPFIAEQRITFTTFSALVVKLRRQLSYHHGYPDWEDDDEIEDEENLADIIDDDWPPLYDDIQQDHFPPDLLSGLEAAAAKDNSYAHYALALIHMPIDVDDREAGIDYWYNQEKSGRVLTGVEKEWSDNYAKMLTNDAKFEFHLREAGRLGNEQALLDLADKFDDPSFFEAAKDLADHNPLRAAEVAEKLGRKEDVHHWLSIAAKAGDIHSILRLIEEFENHDLQSCWTWLYFAQLLGTDLTRDDYYAINEDGSIYDDDVGGPLHVAGRGGINITPLSENQDSLARQAAQEIFDSLH